MKVLVPELLILFSNCSKSLKIMGRFLHTKSRVSQLGAANPLEEGAESSTKASRALNYKEKRDQADKDTTSRLR